MITRRAMPRDPPPGRPSLGVQRRSAEALAEELEGRFARSLVGDQALVVARVRLVLRRAPARSTLPAGVDLELAERPVDRSGQGGGAVDHVERARGVKALERVAALQIRRRVGQLRTTLGAPLGHHYRLAGIEVAKLADVGLEQLEVLHPAVPAEVLVQPDQVERVQCELLREAGAALDVNGDRE